MGLGEKGQEEDGRLRLQQENEIQRVVDRGITGPGWGGDISSRPMVERGCNLNRTKEVN